MLKITLHDRSRELRMNLEGKVSGAWVNELRQCWLTAASTLGNRSAVLDLREVDFVDPEGQSLLSSMHSQGVKFVAASPLIQCLLRQICHSAQCVTVEGKLARSPHASSSGTNGCDSGAL